MVHIHVAPCGNGRRSSRTYVTRVHVQLQCTLYKCTCALLTRPHVHVHEHVHCTPEYLRFVHVRFSPSNEHYFTCTCTACTTLWWEKNTKGGESKDENVEDEVSKHEESKDEVSKHEETKDEMSKDEETKENSRQAKSRNKKRRETNYKCMAKD